MISPHLVSYGNKVIQSNCGILIEQPKSHEIAVKDFKQKERERQTPSGFIVDFIKLKRKRQHSMLRLSRNLRDTNTNEMLTKRGDRYVPSSIQILMEPEREWQHNIFRIVVCFRERKNGHRMKDVEVLI